jgi:hypothetical protein
MALSTYTELQSSIAAWSYRTDLTTIIPDFIALTESDMQIRCKLMEFESSATLAVVSGVATLPTDFKGHRAAYLDGNQKTPLRYVTPDRFDAVSNNSGTGLYFTITDDTFKMAPMSDGSVVLTYHAKFTPLSGSNASNSILANYPDAYLYGSLIQMARYTKDMEAMQTTMPMYEAVISRINKDNQDRKYPGPLQVRAA